MKLFLLKWQAVPGLSSHFDDGRNHVCDVCFSATSLAVKWPMTWSWSGSTVRRSMKMTRRWVRRGTICTGSSRRSGKRCSLMTSCEQACKGRELFLDCLLVFARKERTYSCWSLVRGAYLFCVNHIMWMFTQLEKQFTDDPTLLCTQQVKQYRVVTMWMCTQQVNNTLMTPCECVHNR